MTGPTPAEMDAWYAETQERGQRGRIWASRVMILITALREARAETEVKYLNAIGFKNERDEARAEVERLTVGIRHQEGLTKAAWDDAKAAEAERDAQVAARARAQAMAERYDVVHHQSCDVSPALGSQWRNTPHWHVVWPDGGHWCYETKVEALERVVELYHLADDAADWRRARAMAIAVSSEAES